MIRGACTGDPKSVKMKKNLTIKKLPVQEAKFTQISESRLEPRLILMTE